jgi:uncharacterized membrane protein HdeD (DUF308 family)
MTESALREPIKKVSGWGIAFAILIILAGFVAIALPFESGVAIAIVIGWLLVISGVFHLADAFHSKGAGAVIWRVLIGLVFIVGGIDIAFFPLRGLFTLTFVLGIILVVQGVISIVSYWGHRRMHGVGWILFNGLVSVLLGGLIWYDGPGAAVWIIGTLVGIHLIFNGITRLMIWSAVRKAVSGSGAPAPA